jgi:hypothetical protein
LVIYDGDGKLVSHKGIKEILEERGLWREAASLRVPKSHVRKGYEGPSSPGVTILLQEKMHLDEARILLKSQPDFQAQLRKNWIQETVEKYGHIAIFGPKFHPELSAIEYFWGEAKRYARSHCDYSWEGLQATVPDALSSVSLGTIRRQFEHVQRYMQAYRYDTLSNPQVEWAMRKYTSHRRAKDVKQDELDEEFLTPSFMTDMPLLL